MRIFFDASALVKRYVPEDGTALVNELFDHLSLSQMTCTMLGILEIVSVLARKRNDGRIPQHLFAQALLELNREVLESDFSLVTVDNSLLLSALPLIVQHNINATDAIILRTCLNLHATLVEESEGLILWSCDKRLLRAAKQEGLLVFDPEVESVTTLHSLHAIP